MKFSIALVLGFSVLSGSANAQVYTPAAADNLLVNGGFNAAGWPPSAFTLEVLLQGWAYEGVSYTYRPYECLDGGGEICFSGPDYISQVVDTMPGQIYRLTLTARTFGYTVNDIGQLLPEWEGVAMPVATVPTTYTAWSEISYDVQATRATTLFKLSYVINGPTWEPVWVDSVTLVPIPEPSNLLFFLAILGTYLFEARWNKPVATSIR